jgi:hypothetical protein
VHKLEDIRSADEATGDGDGHVISVADRREGGKGPTTIRRPTT